MSSYIAKKLGRLSDAYNKAEPAVTDGIILNGKSVNAYVYHYDFKAKEKADVFIPVVGQCVWIEPTTQNGFKDFIRTSVVQDFYIHEDHENSKDKIVLKTEDALLLSGIEFLKGDIIFKTHNSLYYLKAI